VGSENLIAPELTVGPIDVQFASTLLVEEMAYTYQRADGTVERAFNAEDAIARCPVLGKLAIEAPDQANVILELAASGKAKMAAEARQELEKPNSGQKQAERVKPEKLAVPSPANKQTRTQEPIMSKAEPVAVTPHPIVNELDANPQVESVERQIQAIEDLAVLESIVETQIVVEINDEKTVRQVRQIEATVITKFEPVKSYVAGRSKVEVLAPPNDFGQQQPEVSKATALRTIASAVPLEEKVTRLVDRTFAPPRSPRSETGLTKNRPSSVNVSTDTSPAEKTVFLSTGFALESTLGCESPIELSPINNEVVAETGSSVLGENNRVGAEKGELDDAVEQIINTLEVEACIVDIEAEHADKLYGTSEPYEYLQPLAIEGGVIATEINHKVETDRDEQLRLLFETETIETYRQLAALTVEEETSEAALPDIAQTELDILIETESEVDTEAAVVMDLETFIAARLVTEVPLTLKAIQERACEQPLEQTFIQLAEYLHAVVEVAEEADLWTIMWEIKEALPACYIYQESAVVEPKPRITPEMTEKLLLFLRTLGYEDPGETLVNFVAKHSLVFLLQVLEYMGQLNSNDNRREFLIASAITTTSDDNVRLRLGKLLFGLITSISYEPSVRASA
jgi:hypothetical protein